MMLTPSDRTMLAKLLGMTGSSHDGEVITAARMAHQLLASRGASWPDVLGIEAARTEAPHIALARDLLTGGRGICTRWETDFLRGILAFKVLSSYQLQTLDGIAGKVAAALENRQRTD